MTNMNEPVVETTGTSDPSLEDVNDTSSDTNWSELAHEQGVDDDNFVPAAKPVVVDEVPAAPAPVAAPTPAPAPAPEATPAPAPVAEPVQPEVKPAEVDYSQLEMQFLEKLTKDYGLTEEQTAQMLTAPETVLPRLAAQVHNNVLKQVLVQMQAVLPAMIQTVQASVQSNQSAQDKFFAAWPQLRGQEQMIQSVGTLWRSQNPRASEEEAIQAIGRGVNALLGITTPATQPAQPTPQFKPAAPGGAGGLKPVVPETNPFAALADEFLQED